MVKKWYKMKRTHIMFVAIKKTFEKTALPRNDATRGRNNLPPPFPPVELRSTTSTSYVLWMPLDFRRFAPRLILLFLARDGGGGSIALLPFFLFSPSSVDASRIVDARIIYRVRVITCVIFNIICTPVYIYVRIYTHTCFTRLLTWHT